MTSLYVSKFFAKKDRTIFPPEISSGKTSSKKVRVFAGEKFASLASLQRTIDQVRFRRASKKRTREKRTTKPYENRTTIVVLPSPRSLFSSIERRLDCRFLSTVGQRNQIRRKLTITTPIQGESIRQLYTEVNNYLLT